MARPRSAQICCSAKCQRVIGPTEKGIAVTLFAQTMGMGKRRSSKSERLYLCPQCAMRIAMENEPPKSAPVDRAYFRIMLDLGGSGSDVVQAAGELLEKRRTELLYPPALPEGEIIPPSRALKAAV
jgi:hypothetical protein